MNRTAVIWIVVIVILIILGVVIWGGNDRDDLDEINITDTDTDTSGDVSGSVIGDNALNIDAQPVGSTARASMVSLEGRGFAVVHEELANGGAGAVLGASALLPAGQSNNVAIPLRSALVDGKTYIVMLHIDNGDGVFSESSDPIARDANGDAIMMGFDADADAEAGTSQSI